MKWNPGKMLCRSYIIVQHTTVCALYKYNKSTSSKGQPPARREDELTYIDKDWRIHVVTYHIFQNKCMYNRFPLKMKKEWPREKREKDGTEEGGSPKKEKKRKRKTEKPRPLSLCVVCYSDTFPRSFIHTHIRSTTHTHTYIYIYQRYLYIQTQRSTPNMVVRKLPEAATAELENVADQVVVVHRAITHFNRIIHQDLKRAAHIMPLLHRYITVDVFMMTKRSDSDDKSRIRLGNEAFPILYTTAHNTVEYSSSRASLL